MFGIHINHGGIKELILVARPSIKIFQIKKFIYNSNTLFKILFWIYCLSDEIHASVVGSRIDFTKCRYQDIKNFTW